MSDYFERIAAEWRERAPELGAFAYAHLVNRTDVWGRYLAKRYRKKTGGQAGNAITAPFRDERGKVFLQESSLVKHFRTRSTGGVLGLHSVAADNSSRWLAIDIDLHDDDDLSVTAEGNFVAARGWADKLRGMGFDPLLFDSNGKGGFHIWVVFAMAMDTRKVHAFVKELTSDYGLRGLDQQPEVFPSSPHIHHYGSWLRIPGRHHTRDHYTRVYNDEEPWDDRTWLEGHDAIDRLLGVQLASPDLLERHGLVPRRKIVCLDFDGVIHSYTSGWCGEDVIPDPPIHRVDESIARLRKHFEVVVHSARCRTEDGREAIRRWLDAHNITVDEVCEHKPPAHIYVDDRAIPFQGDWDDCIAAIHDFRK